MLRLTYEIDRETDGRWIIEILELPGVLAYGETLDKALDAAKALAFRVLAEQIEHHEIEAKRIERVEFHQAA